MNSVRFDTNNYEYNPNGKIGIYLIHGFSSTTYEMNILANHLKENSYHVVSNNLPGHGTTVEECNKYKYNDWLNYSKQEFAKLCSTSEKIFIIGCSMGGVIALHLASLFPVDGIIVGGVVLKFQLPFQTNYLNTILCRFLKVREKKMVLSKDQTDKINFYGYTSYPLIALNEFKKMNRRVIKELKKIKAPVLIIHSDSDRVSIKDNIAIVKDNVLSKSIKILNVQHAHHNIFDTNKDTSIILSAIDNFITKH
tara:strand:+ start:1046 stop:1801 length:756 start_codon:yes stop_codon:yes gene_type:complete